MSVSFRLITPIEVPIPVTTTKSECSASQKTLGTTATISTTCMTTSTSSLKSLPKDVIRFAMVYPNEAGVEEFESINGVKNGPAKWFGKNGTRVSYQYINNIKVFDNGCRSLVPSRIEGQDYTLCYPGGKYITFQYVNSYKEGPATKS